MIQMNDRKLDALDDFLVKAIQAINNLDHYTQFFKVSEDKKAVHRRALQILHEKRHVMEHASSVKEVKQVVDVKKITKGL